MHQCHNRVIQWLAFVASASCIQVSAHAPANPRKPPVWIGFDDDYGQKTNTTAMAIEWGIRAAMEEINAKGGVLNGRPLQLATTDNKGIAARGKDNFIQLAANTQLVAVLTGKHSPISVGMLREAHRLQVPLVSVWGSADGITDHDQKPSYSFRVSLKDSWGVEAMMKRLQSKYKVSQGCAIVPNNEAGRSAERVIRGSSLKGGVQFPTVVRFDMGAISLKSQYQACMDAQTQGVIFVGSEISGAALIKEIAAHPHTLRLPVVSNLGPAGGTLHEMAKDELPMVRIEFIQTFTFIQNTRPRAVYLADWILKKSGLQRVHDIPSPAGAAHAYDAVHLIASAIQTAQTTSPPKIRDALENLPPFNGAIRHYAKPFTDAQHNALNKSQVLFVKLSPSGQLTPQD